MSNSISGFGKIIGIKQKTAEELNSKEGLLEISVSVPTGQKKKEGDDYAPSNIYTITLWGTRADALAPYASTEKHVYFSGTLAASAYVTKDGNTGVQLAVLNPQNLKFVKVVYDEAKEDGETSTKSSGKSEVSKVVSEAKQKQKQRAQEAFKEDFDEDDIAF
jgi:single-stranded DNA-binding protein